LPVLLRTGQGQEQTLMREFSSDSSVFLR